jgi:hypothetical protein
LRLASIAFRALTCIGALWCAQAGAQSIRFVGNADDNVDRVTINVGNGQPANIGAEDFTIEFWMRAGSGNNQAAPGRCNDTGYNWTTGNILLDRDRSPPNYRDFGLAIMGGRVVFGIEPTQGNSYTMCSTANVRDDGDWHHVAVQRRRSDGFLWIYIDGQLDQQVNGPDGDVSYPAGVGSPPESLLVLGAEKFDFDTSQFPGFRGWIDELRISNQLQYSANFTPQTTPFSCSGGAVALYHFDEGTGNAVGDACGASPATRAFGGNPPGPEWSTETPMNSTPGPTPGQLRFSASTYAANEATNQLITVRRLNGSDGAASVDVAVTGGTATANADYQLAPTTLSWTDGDDSDRTFTITMINDTAVEGSETINLALSNPAGAALGTPASAVVTIAASDSAPSPGTLQFTAATHSVTENTGTLTVTVSRSGGSAGAATIDATVTGGTATADADYQLAPTTLNWSDGDATNKTFSITLINDTELEDAETINLSLSNATGATLGTPASAVVTIAASDSPPGSPGQVRFSASTYSANEGTASRVITVRRVNGSTGAATVGATVTGGTATASADYQLTPPTLSWPDGDATNRTFTITIINDTAVEGAETINLALSNPTGATLGTPASAVVTIAASDSPPTNTGTLQFTASAFTVAEDTATLAVTVSRSGGSTGVATVNVDLNGGNATLDSDYFTGSTLLSWNGGQQGSRTFTITLLNDALVEGDETIELLLTDQTGAALGAQSSAIVTITDNDQDPPPPPPPPPPSPPTPPPTTPTPPATSGGGGGSIGWPLLLAALCAAVLRCRLPLHPP